MFIGSGVSVFVSVLAFKLYTSAWHVRALLQLPFFMPRPSVGSEQSLWVFC